MRYIFTLFFLLVGCGMLYFAYTQYSASTDLLKNGTRTPGTIIENIESWSDDDYVYYPVVEFVYNGEYYQFESDVGTSPPAYMVGDTVEILHPKEHPEGAQINDFWSLWFVSIMIAFFGIIFAVVGGVALWVALKKAQNIGDSALSPPTTSNTPPPSGPINI